MAEVDIGGAMLWGATRRQMNASATLADNPYPDSPGWYVKRKAWAYGFEHAAEVLAEHEGEDPNDPIYEDVRGPSKRSAQR